MFQISKRCRNVQFMIQPKYMAIHHTWGKKKKKFYFQLVNIKNRVAGAGVHLSVQVSKSLEKVSPPCVYFWYVYITDSES